MVCKLIGVGIIFPKPLQQRKPTEKWQEQFYSFFNPEWNTNFSQNGYFLVPKTSKVKLGPIQLFYLVGTSDTFHGRGRLRRRQVVKLTNHHHPVPRVGATCTGRRVPLHL